jgi:hypothetical protein
MLRLLNQDHSSSRGPDMDHILPSPPLVASPYFEPMNYKEIDTRESLFEGVHNETLLVTNIALIW